MWRGLRLQARVRQLTAPLAPKRPEDHVYEAEKKSELLGQVDRLSTKHREVIVLRYYQECSFEEIADSLGVPIGTVKSRHHHALRRLKGLIGEYRAEREGAEYVH